MHEASAVTNSLRGTFLLQKLIVTQLIKKFSAFLETEGSLPCSQQPATGPCPVPDESSPHFPPYFRKIHSNIKRRDSSVGIALGYGLEDRSSRVRFLAGAGNFSLRHRVQTGSGPTQPPIQWVPWVLFLG
jgi:hypothetical protein